MDEMIRKLRLGACMLLPLLAGCGQGPRVVALPEVSETVRGVGRRLSGSLSESRLSAIATRGEVLLGVLNARERDALARGYVRFHSPVPLQVDVAAPSASAPFWLQDQGFVSTGVTLDNDDAHWTVFRKTFDRGWVGLGVNGLDRTPPAHYVASLRSAQGFPRYGSKRSCSRSATRTTGRSCRCGRESRGQGRASSVRGHPGRVGTAPCSSVPPTTGAMRRSWPPGGSGRRTYPREPGPTRLRLPMDPTPPASLSGPGGPARRSGTA